MIECKVNKREAAVMASGSTVELAAELGLLIREIYNAMKDNNPDNADAFRFMMKRGLDDDSPVWDRSEKHGVAIVMSSPGKKGEA